MQHPNAILRERGLKPSKHRGQNFLTQFATAQGIARNAGIASGDVVVEIGSGLGALTLALAQEAKKVIAVEVDRGVFAALEDILSQAGAGNVELREADALKLDWAELAAQAGGPVKVAGNLPYVISSPLLFRLIDAREHWLTASLMVQQELAVRLAAGPGNRDYGRLTVLVQTWCGVKAGMKIGPDQFYPRPAVASRVVHLTSRETPLVELKDEGQAKWYSQVVKAAFSHRRKTLLNSLAGGLAMEKPAIAEALQQAGIDPKRRAETLEIEEFGSLSAALATPART